MKFDEIEGLSTRANADDGPSSLDLDRLAAGQALPDVLAQIRENVELHNTLKQRRQGLAAVDGVDAVALKARVLASADASRPSFFARLFKMPAVWVGLPAVVAGLFFLLRPVAVEPSADLGVRQKGGAKLLVFRKVEGGASKTMSGEVFHPGDVLKFKVSLPTRGQIRVIGIDAEGTLYRAWPLAAHVDAQTVLPAGEAHELSGAIELDDSVGNEMLYLIHCPPDVEPNCASNSARATPACSTGCTSTPFTVKKGTP